jgi:hypothetical protein
MFGYLEQMKIKKITKIKKMPTYLPTYLPYLWGSPLHRNHTFFLFGLMYVLRFITFVVTHLEISTVRDFSPRKVLIM